MRIAFILSTIGNYGPFIIARDIVNNIVDKPNVTVDIYYLKESNTKLLYKANYFKIKFRSKIDFKKYDLIHTHGFLADAYMYYHKRRFLGKWMTTVHQEIKTDYAMQYNQIISIWLEKIWIRFISKSDCVITLTKGMAAYYQSVLKDNNILHIYNGITPVVTNNILESDLKKIINFKNNYEIIGVSARVILRKGIDQIIRSLYLNENKNIALLVIGDGDQKDKLKGLANELGVIERCLFLGYKGNAIDYFKYFDLYVMSSRSEAFGLCVLEAASQNIPVVCSDLPVYHELFEDDEVVMYKLENISSLCISINYALNNKLQLVKKIRNKYYQSYTAETMAQNYFDAYLQLVDRN